MFMINFLLNEDGIVLNVEVDYYVWCLNGVSMVIIVCIYGMLNGKGFYGEFVVDSDEMIFSLSCLVIVIKD